MSKASANGERIASRRRRSCPRGAQRERAARGPPCKTLTGGERRWMTTAIPACFCFARPSEQGITGPSARLESTDHGTCGKDIKFSHNREDVDSGNLGNFTVTIGRHFGCCAQYGARPAFPSSYQAIPRASRVAGGRGRVLFCFPSTTPRLLRCFEMNQEL